jgi:hypothetical protein
MGYVPFFIHSLFWHHLTIRFLREGAMGRSIYFVVMLAALLLAAPAAADWQNTRWGMTEAQVARLPGYSLSDGRGEPGRAVNGMQPRYVFPYATGSLSFRGAMYFGGPGGGLSMVTLQLVNYRDWTALVAALTQRYGLPARDEPMSMASRAMRWYTQREEVQYFHQLVTSPQGSATVTYISRDGAAAKGL